MSALAILLVVSLVTPATGEAQTPYCGVDIRLPPSQFAFDGPCNGTLPVGFLSLTEDRQYELLDEVSYALKSPARERRCDEPACKVFGATRYIEARIQAARGTHKFHPGATPRNAFVVFARIHHVRSVGTTSKDSLTGSRRVEEDYFVLVRRDPADTTRSRTIFLGFRQSLTTGQWTKFSAADDGVATVCAQSHTPLKLDMADFVPCTFAHAALARVGGEPSVYKVWEEISAEIANRHARARYFMDRRMFDSLPSIGYYANAFGRRDNSGWAPCALGCCVIWRN